MIMVEQIINSGENSSVTEDNPPSAYKLALVKEIRDGPHDGKQEIFKPRWDSNS